MSPNDYPFDPPIDLDLGNNPGHVRFARLSEFHAWLDNDYKTWMGLLQLFIGGDNAGVLGVRALEKYEKEVVGSARYVSNIVARDAVNSILNKYLAKIILHSKSHLGIKIQYIARSGDCYSSGLMLAISNKGGLDQTQSDARAILNLRACAEISGFFSDEGDAHVKQMKDVVADAQREIMRLTVDAVDLRNALDKAKDARTKIESFISKEDERNKDSEDRLEKSLSKHEDEFQGHLKSALESVETAANIKSSVDYWSRKYWGHIGIGLFLTLLFVAGVGGAIWAVWEHSQSFLAHIGLAEVKGAAEAKLDPTRLVLALVPVVGILWVLRLISRLALGNWARSADAAERVAMIETFLALEKDGKTSAVDDRAIIIKALFRSGPGNGQDDGPPGGGLEALVKLLDGGKGGKG